MKSKKLMPAVAGLVLIAGMSSSAFADNKWLGDHGSNWLEHVQSTKSRAEVLAELDQARKDGSLRVGNGTTYPPQPTADNGRTRAEVQANRQGNRNFNSIYFGGA